MLEYTIQLEGNQARVLKDGLLLDTEQIAPQPPPVPDAPWLDMRDDMPVNPHPDNAYFVHYNLSEWWQRASGEIAGITIHHTLAHDMMALADYFTRPVATGGLGTPTSHYAIWITQDGEARYCVDLANGCWHDHTGHENKHISIGLAGRWDYEPPPQVMIDKTVEVCHYLLGYYDLLISSVRGHCDHFSTRCPGWNPASWRQMFYDALVAYNNPSVSFSAKDYYQPERLFDMLRDSGDIETGTSYFTE